MWLLVAALLAQTADFQADGIKALDAKQYDAAVGLFTKAVAADPKDYAAHFHLALAYSLLGKDAEAIAQYKSTLELKPELYEAELNIGICLLRVKDAASAIPYLKNATGAEAQGVSSGVPFCAGAAGSWRLRRRANGVHRRARHQCDLRRGRAWTRAIVGAPESSCRGRPALSQSGADRSRL